MVIGWALKRRTYLRYDLVFHLLPRYAKMFHNRKVLTWNRERNRKSLEVVQCKGLGRTWLRLRDNDWLDRGDQVYEKPMAVKRVKFSTACKIDAIENCPKRSR